MWQHKNKKGRPITVVIADHHYEELSDVMKKRFHRAPDELTATHEPWVDDGALELLAIVDSAEPIHMGTDEAPTENYIEVPDQVDSNSGDKEPDLGGGTGGGGGAQDGW